MMMDEMENAITELSTYIVIVKNLTYISFFWYFLFVLGVLGKICSVTY